MKGSWARSDILTCSLEASRLSLNFFSSFPASGTLMTAVTTRFRSSRNSNQAGQYRAVIVSLRVFQEVEAHRFHSRGQLRVHSRNVQLLLNRRKAFFGFWKSKPWCLPPDDAAMLRLLFSCSSLVMMHATRY